MSEAARLYLELLKKVLVNWIYLEAERGPGPGGTSVPPRAGDRGADPEIRRRGGDWPPFAHSMVGLERLDSLQACVETLLAEGVPGDLLEAGVWRGGASILMRGILEGVGAGGRDVWVCDSFEGLPPPDPERYPADRDLAFHGYRELAVSLDEVRANFARYGLLDERVRFVKGWFKDTLPGLPVSALAVLRLDGDLYESTMDGLTHLYPRLSVGGFVIVDDYGAIPACRQAVEDYRALHRIDEPIQWVDWTGIHWRKGR